MIGPLADSLFDFSPRFQTLAARISREIAANAMIRKVEVEPLRIGGEVGMLECGRGWWVVNTTNGVIVSIVYPIVTAERKAGKEL